MNWNEFDIPAYLVSDEARAWFVGFAMGAVIRVFRTGLRWVKRIGDDLPGD